MGSEVTLNLSHWLYLASVVVIIVTMIFRANVVVPAVVGTFLVVTSLMGNPVNGFIGIFSASFVAARELFNIFLVITFMTALLSALKATGADVLMVRPFPKIMRGGLSSYVVIAVVTYLFSLFFWPTPAVPLVSAVLLPAAIAAGLPPLTGAMVIAITGQGMALSSDYIIGVAPGISAKAAGAAVSAQAVADKALVLSLITGVVALAITFFCARKHFHKPDPDLLVAWQARASDGSNEELEHQGSFDKAEMARAVDYETPPNDARYVAGRRFVGWARVCAVLTPLAVLGEIILLALPEVIPGLPVLRGGDAAGLVGGVAFILMLLATLATVGTRKMLDVCAE